jgi:GAF domain
MNHEAVRLGRRLRPILTVMRMPPDSVLALRTGEDLRSAALRIRCAHEQFVSSHKIPSGVRPVVAGSWHRCAAAGASLDGHRLPTVRMDADRLEDYRSQHPLAVLLPIFRKLLGEQADDSEHIFAVTDAAGMLLWVQGHARTLRRAERMNFVEGAVWSEPEAGTNAPGTALAVGSPVQIFMAEHYNTMVHPWSCSAVPIRDPVTGLIVGAVDITGDKNIASPHALALVRATAHAAEAELALRAAAAGELGRAVHEVVPDGRRSPDRPAGAARDAIVRTARPQPAATEVALSALGRNCALLAVDGRTLQLRPRHSEIVVILALSACGLPGPRLAVELSEENIRPVTLRAEMSRLRTILGGDLLGSHPYALRRPVRSDFALVLDLLAEGRVVDAAALYHGPLLPDSEAPAVAAHRTMVEQQLRAEVLASADAMLLRRWVTAAWGAHDAEAWRVLARHLPGGSPERAAAAARAKVLDDELAAPLAATPSRATSGAPRVQRYGNPIVPSVSTVGRSGLVGVSDGCQARRRIS